MKIKKVVPTPIPKYKITLEEWEYVEIRFMLYLLSVISSPEELEDYKPENWEKKKWVDLYQNWLRGDEQP